MTINPNRVDAGVPTGGQFAKTAHSDRTVTLDDPRAARRAEYNRFAMAADARVLSLKEDANHAQLRNMIDDLRQTHPEAQSFELYVDDDGDIAANFVRDADGNDLEEAEADLTESLRSADPDEMQALGHVTHDVDEMLAWEPEGGLAQDPNDPFAHLTGMDKARAQIDFARQINADAVSAFVDDLSAKLLAINPEFGRLYVTRNTDVEYGTTFRLARVEDIHGNVADVDLYSLTDDDFQDSYLDRHTDYDESRDESYINLEPGQ